MDDLLQALSLGDERRIELLREERALVQDSERRVNVDAMWRGMQSRMENVSASADLEQPRSARTKPFAPKVTAIRRVRFGWPVITAAAAALLLAFALGRFMMNEGADTNKVAVLRQ